MFGYASLYATWRCISVKKKKEFDLDLEPDSRTNIFEVRLKKCISKFYGYLYFLTCESNL